MLHIVSRTYYKNILVTYHIIIQQVDLLISLHHDLKSKIIILLNDLTIPVSFWLDSLHKEQNTVP